VQVVGYDNQRQAWLARNSWGTGFGMNGYFWVSFSAPGMCDGSDTFGLAFKPGNEVQPVAPLQPVPGLPNCFTYRAQPGDYPEKLVNMFGLGSNGLQRLVRDNLDHMPELDRFTPSAPLLVCDIDPRLLPARQAPAVPWATAALWTSKQGNLDTDALLLATSPRVFDGRTAWRGLSVLGPVKNQGRCATAASFAVLGAAQTAAAVALNTSLPAASLSEYELHYCLKDRGVRNCAGGAEFKDVLFDFLRAAHSQKSIALEECVPYLSQNDRHCERRCTGTAAQLWRGIWKTRQMISPTDMQRHIRTYGSIMCVLPLYSDIKEFYKANPRGIYRPGERLDT
jgi:hypothetical protein